MWDAWKKRSEGVEEKAPVFKDREKLENFYECLFDSNDKRPIGTHKKVQIPPKPSEPQAAQLNNETCSKELDSVLKGKVRFRLS